MFLLIYIANEIRLAIEKAPERAHESQEFADRANGWIDRFNERAYERMRERKRLKGEINE